jgi:TfoX/Sxy family transcriptional regulator of competence genes
MAYDEELAKRVSAVLESVPNITEKKMFGGVGYLLNGNMACGVNKETLIVRVGPDSYQATLDEEHTRVFDLTGRPMTGWVSVEPEGLQSKDRLVYWVGQGVAFAGTLPPK